MALFYSKLLIGQEFVKIEYSEMKSEMVKAISKNDLNRVKELVSQGYPINEPTAELGLTWITWYNPTMELGNQGEYQYRKYDYTEDMGVSYYYK